jgi:hypothetical protein
MNKVFDIHGHFPTPADFDHTKVDVEALKKETAYYKRKIRDGYVGEKNSAKLIDDAKCSIKANDWVLDLYANKLAWLEEQKFDFDPMGIYSHPLQFNHTVINVEGLKAFIEADKAELSFMCEADNWSLIASIETSEWLLELHAKKLAWLKKQGIDITIIRVASSPNFAPVPFSPLVCSVCRSTGCRCFDADIPFVDDVCTCSLYFHSNESEGAS